MLSVPSSRNSCATLLRRPTSTEATSTTVTMPMTTPPMASAGARRLRAQRLPGQPRRLADRRPSTVMRVAAWRHSARAPRSRRGASRAAPDTSRRRRRSPPTRRQPSATCRRPHLDGHAERRRQHGHEPRSTQRRRSVPPTIATATASASTSRDDLPARGARGAPHADLAGACGDRHQHGVGDDDDGRQQRHRRDGRRRRADSLRQVQHEVPRRVGSQHVEGVGRARAPGRAWPAARCGPGPRRRPTAGHPVARAKICRLRGAPKARS